MLIELSGVQFGLLYYYMRNLCQLSLQIMLLPILNLFESGNVPILNCFIINLAIIIVFEN